MDNSIRIENIINEMNNPSFFLMEVTEKGAILSDSISKDKLVHTFKERLKRLGIDISKNDYMLQCEGAFEVFEKELIADSNGVVITAAWFIEKYIVKETLLEQIYSPYDMRITRKLTFEELNQEKFFDALAKRYSDADIKRNIKRTGDKAGLLKRLSDVGFDLNAFDGEETEKYRLLFLIYCFERDTGCTIAEYFSNPTSENREDNQFFVRNRNGELTHYLKSNIEKQIPPESLIPYGFSFNQVIDGWEAQFSRLNRMVEDYYEKGTHDDISLSNHFADFIFLEDSLVEEEKQGPYRDRLLNSFYLKILEFESIGIEQDLRDIEEWDLRADHIEEDTERLQKYKDDMVTYLSMQCYFEEQLDDFIKYIYAVKNPDKNIKKKYRRLIELLPCFINILYRNEKPDEKDQYPALLLLACMYEYVHIGNEKIDNRFFRYNTSDLKTLKAELKNGAFAFRKNQCAWISRSYYRYNMIMNREGAEYTVKSATWKLQERFLKVMKCRSIIDLLVLHNFYMNVFNRHFLPEYEVEADMDKFDRRIKEYAPRYKLVNRKELNTRYFFATIHGNEPVMDYLVERMVELIEFCERYEHSERMELNFEFTQNLYGGVDTYYVQIEAWPEKGFLFTWNFKQVYSEAEQRIFFDNGFYIGIGNRY